jgi:hypothetical protein
MVVVDSDKSSCILGGEIGGILLFQTRNTVVSRPAVRPRMIQENWLRLHFFYV